MLRATIHATNQTMATRWAFIAIRALSLLFLISGVGSFYGGHTDLAGFIGLVVLCIVMNMIPLLPRLGVHMKFRKMPNRDKLVTWEVTSNLLKSKTDLAAVEMLWGAVIRVVRLRDGFLLSLQPGIFHWLPKHAFHDPADCERFAALAKARVRRYDDVA